MTVHIGEFYVLEGLKEDGGMVMIAVGYNIAGLIAFVPSIHVLDPTMFIAFHIVHGGGNLEDVPPAEQTHASTTVRN